MAWMREHGSRPLNDVVIHEQDLRGAVGVVGGRDSDGLRIVRDRMAARFAAAVDGPAAGRAGVGGSGPGARRAGTTTPPWWSRPTRSTWPGR